MKEVTIKSKVVRRDGTAPIAEESSSSGQSYVDLTDYVKKSEVTENVLIDDNTLELTEEGKIKVKGSRVVITTSDPGTYEENILYVITG